jgi:hypothetical protein
MLSTSKYNANTFGIPQHGTYWCIPASIENLLRSESILDISQEDLIYQFLIRNVRTAQANGQNVLLSSLPRYAVLEAWRCQSINNASFQTFAPITNNKLIHKGIQKQLTYIEGITSQDDYFSKIESILVSDKPVLISAKNQSGWHITVVYQSDGTNLWSYDPGQGQHVQMSKANYEFSHDLLYIQYYRYICIYRSLIKL